ncbi:MAG: hypothetical protein LIQ30_12110 [Planctomycetes bacterium]|nr:hypothetical protein [Planctomycetota bacterium]MCD7898290.1 hypothetical protein [Planctomycetaceae bacterium]
MTKNNQFLYLLLLACIFWMPPPGKADAGETSRRRGEEYSASSGGGRTTTRMRLQTPAAARAGPVVPKSIAELRNVAGQKYLCVERGQFLVAGDLDLLDYEYLIDGVLDYCADALIRTYFDKGPVRDKTVNVFVFRNYDSYESGLRHFLGMDPISPYGHYGHTQKYIVMNYETGPGTLVHELTHALMSEDFPEAPIWLGEGMASLYEHCRAEGDGLRGDDNWRLPELQAAMAADTLTPLGSLLAMSPSDFRSNRESLHYAQARYFCKFLEEMGLLPRVYKEFRDRYSQDPTGANTLIRAFGRPLEVIDSAWRRWVAYQYWKE